MKKISLLFGQVFEYIKKRPQVQWGLVSIVSSVLLGLLAWSPILSDPDSFYHAGLAVWLRDYGLLNYFPWTQYSFYSQVFIDHHFGYHLLLIPFVSLGGPLLGIKIATWFFASLTLAVLWKLFQFYKVPYWGCFVPAVLSASPFLFRISLAKAPGLSIALLLIGYYLINQKNNKWLFWLAWAFVWFYGAWPLLFIVVVVFILGQYVFDNWLFKESNQSSLIKDYVWLIFSWLGGTLAGLIINPYFPKNFLYLKQLFDMALRPYYSFLSIGAEWYPFPWTNLLAASTFVIGLWLLLTIVQAINWPTLKKQTLITWLISLVFLIYTLRARRQVEYMVPVMALSGGLILKHNLNQLVSWAASWRQFLPDFLKSNLFVFLLAVYLAIALPLGVVIGYGRAYLSLRQGFTYDNLKPAADWLKNHTPSNSLVWQTDWGTFPLLWYHNSHNYYLTGLDQTFMYAFSPVLYDKWRLAVKGDIKDGLYDLLTNDFKVDYVLLEKRTPAML